MEFERQLFRVHERLLKLRGASTCLLMTQIVFFTLTVFFLMNFYLSHATLVNKNHILREQMESQLQIFFHHEYDTHDCLQRSFDELKNNITDIEADNLMLFDPGSCVNK